MNFAKNQSFVAITFVFLVIMNEQISYVEMIPTILRIPTYKLMQFAYYDSHSITMHLNIYFIQYINTIRDIHTLLCITWVLFFIRNIKEISRDINVYLIRRF